MQDTYLRAQVCLNHCACLSSSYLPPIVSDDGSLRIYDLSSYKVVKAVRAIGSEVSSIVCIKRPGSELRDAWVAHGQRVSYLRCHSS